MGILAVNSMGTGLVTQNASLQSAQSFSDFTASTTPRKMLTGRVYLL